MSNLSPRRRRVVVLCAAVGAMSGTGSLLLKNHPVARLIWIAFMIVTLVYAISEIAKLKREGQ
jgi:hypothetical protein